MCRVYAGCLIHIGLFKCYSNSVDASWIHRQRSHHSDLCALSVYGVHVWYTESAWVCVWCVCYSRIPGSHPRPADSDSVGVGLEGRGEPRNVRFNKASRLFWCVLRYEDH